MLWCTWRKLAPGCPSQRWPMGCGMWSHPSGPWLTTLARWPWRSCGLQVNAPPPPPLCVSSCSSTTVPPPMCVIKLLHCHHLFYLCVFMLGSSTACLPTCQTDLCCYYMRLDLEGIQAGVVLSTNFKTAATYRHQPVTVPLLLDVYVKYFRQGSPEVEEVFLTNKGTPMKQGYINRAFADYFAIFDLKVSITDVRKMLESAFFEAMQLNTITYEQYCQASFIYSARKCVSYDIIMIYIIIDVL